MMNSRLLTLAAIGIVVAVVAMQQGECAHMRGSVERWIQIDGHALLFVFLPPLLFEVAALSNPHREVELGEVCVPFASA